MMVFNYNFNMKQQQQSSINHQKTSDGAIIEEPKRKKSNGCIKNSKKFLKNIDRYGIPVGLTYKGEPEITSVVGGLATILARVVIITYLGVSCKGVFDKNYTIQTSMLKRDLTIDKEIYNLTKDNFDFGIRLDYSLRNSEPDVFNNLDQYVDLRVTQNYYMWTKDADGNPVPNRIKNRTNLVQCNPPRLL